MGYSPLKEWLPLTTPFDSLTPQDLGRKDKYQEFAHEEKFKV